MAHIQKNLMDFNEILLNVVRQMYDQYSEEEIKGPLGRAFSYIISSECFDGFIWTKLNPSDSFAQGKETFDVIHSITNMEEDKQLFYNAFHNHQNNSTNNVNIDCRNYNCTAQRMNDKITQCQDTISLETNCNNKIRAAQQITADIVIKTSVITSSVIIILQVVKLHFVWKEISVATNLYNNSTKFKQIETNIVILTNIVEELTQAMQSKNMIQVSQISKRARKIYDQTKTLINNLQVKINGSLERSDISSDGQVLDGFSNFISTVVNGVQLISIFRFVSTSNTIFTIGIIAAFAALTVANIATNCITRKRLNKLREDINSLNNFNQPLDQLYQMVEEPEHFL